MARECAPLTRGMRTRARQNQNPWSRTERGVCSARVLVKQTAHALQNPPLENHGRRASQRGAAAADLRVRLERERRGGLLDPRCDTRRMESRAAAEEGGEEEG